MLKGLKVALLASAALSATGIAVADSGDIEDRIAALEAMVAELKAELAEERADMEEAIVRLDKVERATPTDRTFATNTGFMVGDTTFKILLVGFGKIAISLPVSVTAFLFKIFSLLNCNGNLPSNFPFSEWNT